MNLPKRLSILVMAIAFLTPVSPIDAHHSFAAEFDADKRTQLTGVVTKVEWMNPHVWFYVNVKDEATGKVNNWDWELSSPNGLMRRGWTRNSLKQGDTVTVTGWLAKNAPHVANAQSVTLANGKRVFAGSSAENENPQ